MSRRILAALLAASALSLALFALPLAELVQEYYRDQAIVTLSQHVSSAVPKLADGGASPSLNDDPDYQIGLYDRNGNRVAGTGPDKADDVATAALRGTSTHAVGDDGGVMAAIPVAGLEPTVAVRGASPPAVVDANVRRAWAGIVALGATVFGVVGVAAWFLTRRLVRPVQSLTTDLARLGDGDFTIATTKTGVAEIDAAHDALAITATRLGDTLERERAFSSDVAHQLRTPITSLRLGIESEMSAPRADPTLALREALDEVDRLAATTEELLTLARAPTTASETVDLHTLLDQLPARWQRLFENAGRPFTVEADDDPIAVVAHAGRLSQALDILVDNALQHGAGTTTVAATTLGGHVHLTVRDEGPGIRPARRPSHGEEPSRRAIGLDLARRLIENEGGRLQMPAGPRPSVTILLLGADEEASASARR